MKMTENRFDPSALTTRQLRELDRLSEAVLADERPALVGREGVRLELPEPIFHLLVRVVRTMREGKAVGSPPQLLSLIGDGLAKSVSIVQPGRLDLAAQIIQGRPAATVPLALKFHQILQIDAPMRAHFVMRDGILFQQIHHERARHPEKLGGGLGGHALGLR